MNHTVLCMSLETDIAGFLDSIVHERRLAENTRLVYKHGLERFSQFVKDGGIANYQSPQPAELARYLEALCGQGLAAASRAIAIVSLRLFYQWLVTIGRLTAHAARHATALTTPKLPERLPRVLTVDGICRLLNAPSRTARLYLRDKALLEFLYGSGCRASEATGLRLENLDLEAMTARVVGKGSKERLVLLGEPAAQAMYAYLYLLRPDLIRRQSEAVTWVFVSQTGQQLDRKYIWALVHSYAVKAGLPQWVGAHSLRHAAGTHTIQGGADVRFVQEILGHSNVQTTTAYLHLDSSHLKRVRELFEAYRKQSTATPTAQEESVTPCPPFDPSALPLDRPRLGWTEEEDEIVRTLPFKEALARLPDHTAQALAARRRALGVRTKDSRPWTAEEDTLVRALPVQEAAQCTGRTLSAIRYRRRVL